MSHTCHWNDCEVEVPPKMWGCKKHWFMLPLHIRQRIWATYRPGQEIDKQPSEAYLDAAMDARTWIVSYLEGKAAIHSLGKQTGALSQESIDKLNAMKRRLS